MLRDRRTRRILLGVTVLAGFAGCGQGEDLAGPRGPALRVTTETSGSATDPDGYALVVDGRGAIPMQPLDTILETGLAPGAHTVDLQGVSAGCSVQGGSSRSVAAAEGTTAAVDFSVACTAPEPGPTGTIRVTLATSGADLDPDGYVLGVDPLESRAVGVSDDVRIEGVAAGGRNLRLSGVAANCSVQGDNPRAVEVPAGEEVDVSFSIRCWPPVTGQIAFARTVEGGLNSLRIIAPDGTELEDFFPLNVGAQPSWSPDGRFIAFVDVTVFVEDVSTGVATALTDCFPSGIRPAWSPDGQRLLCLTPPSSLGRSLTSLRRDGTGPRAVGPSGLSVVSARYLADGSLLLVAEGSPGGGLYRVPPSGGTAVHLFDLPRGVFLLDEPVVPSRDGSRLMYVRTRDTGRNELYVTGPAGADPRLVSGDLQLGSAVTPAWSPDAQRIAMVVSGADGGYHLWLVNPDGSGLLPIEAPVPLGFDGSVDWSPDGTRVAFAVPGLDAQATITSSIYTVRADGSGMERVTASDAFDAFPAWAP